MDVNTDTNGTETVFQRALDAAIGQREIVRAEMAELTDRLDALKMDDANLSQTVTGLFAILKPRMDAARGPQVEPGPDAEVSVGVQLPASASASVPASLLHGADGTNRDAGEEGHDEDEPPLPQPTMLSRRVAPDSSPYRVGLILRAAQRPMERDAIIAEYISRGWVDAKWQGDPANNIAQALRRSEKYGWVRQLPNARRLYVTTQSPDAQLGLGGDDRERLMP